MLMQKVVTILQFTRSDSLKHTNRILQIAPCKTTFTKIVMCNVIYLLLNRELNLFAQNLLPIVFTMHEIFFFLD